MHWSVGRGETYIRRVSSPEEPLRERGVALGSPDGKAGHEAGSLAMKQLGPKFPPHLHAASYLAMLLPPFSTACDPAVLGLVSKESGRGSRLIC